MTSDYALPTSRPRPFVTVAYVASSGLALVPAVMPRSCVHASTGDPACVLVVHHTRERKAGPQIPVTVVHCQTHRRAFTLYPLGHVPYGRLAVAPVTLDGEVMLSTESELPADDRRSPAWRATQLGAAFAAADDPTVKLTDRRWWATQTAARLAQSAALLGVHPGLAAPDVDAIAFRLEVPRLVLRQAADAYAHARGRAARGRVLVGVIDQLGADACLLDRILAAGTCTGCWATVTRWDRASRGRAVRCSQVAASPPGEPESPTAALRILRRARPAPGCADRADRGADPWPIEDLCVHPCCSRLRRRSATRSSRR